MDKQVNGYDVIDVITVAYFLQCGEILIIHQSLYNNFQATNGEMGGGDDEWTTVGRKGKYRLKAKLMQSIQEICSLTRGLEEVLEKDYED